MNKVCDSTESTHDDPKNNFALPTDRSGKMPPEL